MSRSSQPALYGDMESCAQVIRQGYEHELAFLLGRINYERAPERANSIADFRLARMRELLRRLGDPHLEVPCAHITGSKGKGSTSTMLARVLEQAGLRVGLFTSPHLNDFRERLTVNGELPEHADLWPMMQRLHAVADEMDRDCELGGPTFFELTTALGWLCFQHHSVDFVVLEVGLGGRLDSTNLCAPLVTAITSVSHDHNRLLGNTLAEIAREKAGITKARVPMISGATDSDARHVIREITANWRAPLVELGTDLNVEVVEAPGDFLVPLPLITVEGLSHRWSDLPLGMPGKHQARNAGLCVAMVEELRKAVMVIPESAVREGLRQARVPGRIEVRSTEPLIIFDVAHNVASIEALCQTLSTVPARQRWVIFASSRDKHVAEMLQQLKGFADHLVVTQYLNNPRAVPASELQTLAQQSGWSDCPQCHSPQSALEWAQRQADKSDMIVVTGSVFLVAELPIAKSGHC